MTSPTLRDRLKVYPGGLVQLAKDCGLPNSALYEATTPGNYARMPYRVIHAVAAAWGDKPTLEGEPMTIENLSRWWAAEQPAVKP